MSPTDRDFRIDDFCGTSDESPSLLQQNERALPAIAVGDLAVLQAMRAMHGPIAPTEDMLRVIHDDRAPSDDGQAEAVCAHEYLQRTVSGGADVTDAVVATANICLMAFEQTRVDLVPNPLWLRLAELNVMATLPSAASLVPAWSVAALTAYRCNDVQQAIHIARTSSNERRRDWRLRLTEAVVSWGGYRIRAADQALALCPELPCAHWLKASALIARQRWGKATEELRGGCALSDASPAASTAGLHWLHGLVLARLGLIDAALEEFHREIATDHVPNLHGREAAAGSWSAIGALHLRHGRTELAIEAFYKAFAIMPAHPATCVGMTAAQTGHRDLAARLSRFVGVSPEDPGSVDAALAIAAAFAVEGNWEKASTLCRTTISSSIHPSAGWLVPVDPLLNATTSVDEWTSTLKVIADRAI